MKILKYVIIIIMVLLLPVLLFITNHATSILQRLYAYNQEAVDAHLTLVNTPDLSPDKHNYLEQSIGMADYMNKKYSFKLNLAIATLCPFFLGGLAFGLNNIYKKWISSYPPAKSSDSQKSV